MQSLSHICVTSIASTLFLDRYESRLATSVGTASDDPTLDMLC